ncbi:MAG: ketopantoate reductase family protein, partial [Anaerolineae bacterium]|nr:ketopantoate reductase family protein [Anaerolineae bacterium]
NPQLESKELTIVIFGVGAMGCLFGSRLHPRAEVTLFGHWSEQIQSIRQSGLTVTELDGRQVRYGLRITNVLAEVPPADVALILVKSRQTPQAACEAAQVLADDGLAITLQNGLGNFERLIEAVGQQRAVQGVTAQGATLVGPGHVRHAGHGPTHLAQPPDSPRKVAAVVELFNTAGLPTRLVDNAESLIWGKLAINAGINPLTALFEVSNGALLEKEEWREVMIAAALEVANVAQAQGITLPFDDVASQIVQVSRATTDNRSSMLQDMDRGATTEIEAIAGAVVTAGRRVGVPTPVNARLLQLVKKKEVDRIRLETIQLPLG